MQWFRQLPERLLALTIVLVPPLLLGWWIHHTSPGWPSVNGLAAWVADPLTPQTLTAGLIFLGGVLWAVASAQLMAAFARHLRRTWYRLRRIPLPTPAQATATSIAGVAAFGVPAGALSISPPSTDLPPTSTALDHAHPPGDHTDAPTMSQSVGVDLPDGSWVPEPLAEAIASTAGVVWVHRRRWYQPGTGSYEDLTPLPGTVTALQAATLPATDNDPAPEHTEPRPAERVLALADLPARVVLTGPGAYAAARGILVTSLLTTPHSGTRPDLVITADDLTTLLGDTATGLPPINGLHVTPTLEAALAVIGRPAPAHSGVASPANPPAVLPVLVTRVPADAHQQSRLDGVLTHAAPHTAVLFSAHPVHGAYHVDADGHLDHRAGAHRIGSRLCVLSPRAAVDLLTLTVLATPTPTPTTTTAGPQPTTSRPRSTTDREREAGSGNHPTPALRLQVLGHPVLTHHGAPLPLRRSAAFQALILLTLHPNGATARQMTEAIWPALHPHTIAQRFYTTISELRTALRAATGEAVVRRHDDRYFLDPHHIDVDVWQLQEAIDRVADSITPTHRRAALQAVIRAYTGDLGAGTPWPWLEVHRELLRRHTIDAYAELAAATPQQAQQLLQQAVTIEPLNDELHQRAMRALTDAGDHTTAN